MALFGVLSLSLLAGCSTLRSKAASESVISARQKSMQGMEAAQQNNWEEAEKKFAESVKLCPVDERARRQYAEALWNLGREKEAILEMEEAVRLSARSAELHVQLGEMHLAKGNLSAARTEAMSALESNPKLASAWALRGGVNRRQDKLDAALADFHRALSYQPHFPKVQLAAAEVYQAQNRPQRRLATLQALVDQFPPNAAPGEVLLQQGLAYKEMQRYEAAASSLRASIDRGEKTSEAYFHLGESQLLAGNAANASLSLEQALAINPEHTDSRLLQATIIGRREQIARQP